jgi:hypothetical protein
MTIPKISLGCLVATMQKATQNEPDRFAMETMTALASDQPDLMSAVQHLVSMFMGEDDESEEDESDAMVTADFAKEMICMSTFCVLGVAMKAIGATLEAADLENQWGSSDGDDE